MHEDEFARLLGERQYEAALRKAARSPENWGQQLATLRVHCTRTRGALNELRRALLTIQADLRSDLDERQKKLDSMEAQRRGLVDRRRRMIAVLHRPMPEANPHGENQTASPGRATVGPLVHGGHDEVLGIIRELGPDSELLARLKDIEERELREASLSKSVGELVCECGALEAELISVRSTLERELRNVVSALPEEPVHPSWVAWASTHYSGSVVPASVNEVVDALGEAHKLFPDRVPGPHEASAAASLSETQSECSELARDWTRLVSICAQPDAILGVPWHELPKVEPPADDLEGWCEAMRRWHAQLQVVAEAATLDESFLWGES